MAKNTYSLCGGLDPHKTAIYSFFSCSGFLDLGFEMVEGLLKFGWRMRLTRTFAPAIDMLVSI